MTATRRANPTYYGGDLRRDLLDTALELIDQEGPSAVSLRSLARRLGVSHAAPANHFPDKAALFTAIAVGLSAPYLVLSIFPQAIKVLPRFFAHDPTFVGRFKQEATVIAKLERRV